MKAKNLKEFKALKKRYESITLEEIKEENNRHKYMDNVAESLIGFGNEETCSLCKCVTSCSDCIYAISPSGHCNAGINSITFNRIQDADTPLKLRNAFRARAKHMKTLLS